MCNCRICRLGRFVNRTVANGSHRQKNRLIRDLEESLFYAEDSLNYERAIADGSWPTAIEILQKRLDSANKRKLDGAQ
jgi:hypothetical protein